MFERIASAFRARGSQRPGHDPGLSTVATGLSAVAATEARLADALCLGPGFPSILVADTSSPEGIGTSTNLFGHRLVSRRGSDSRGALAMGSGMALAGLRTTVFASSSDLVTGRDLLTRAAGQGIPLVVHMVGGGSVRQGIDLEGDHDAFHALADTGAVLLMVANVQEAVDFSFIARRVAEEMLVPVVVAMDLTETALSFQDVRLPVDALIRDYLGNPADPVTASTAAQDLVFGRNRRRVPRGHDLDRPVLVGPFQDGLGALGGAARHVTTQVEIAGCLDRAMASLGTETGRAHRALTGYRADGAERLLIAQGAATETLRGVVDWQRQSRIKVGLLEVRSLRPFPAAAIAQALGHSRDAVVLERLLPAPGGDCPLLREARSAAGNADVVLTSAIYGVGGHPLRVNDLELLVQSTPEPLEPLVFLGMEFAPASSTDPKREVLLDRLRRDYPNAQAFGLRSSVPPDTILPQGSLSLEVHRLGRSHGRVWVSEATAMLHAISGDSVRTRSRLSWDSWGEGELDRLSSAPQVPAASGDDAPADLAVWHPTRIAPPARVATHLRDGAAVLLEAGPDAGTSWDWLTEDFKRQVVEKNLKLFTVSIPDAADETTRDELLLGALFGVLRATGQIDASTRTLVSERRTLMGAETGDAEPNLDAFRDGLESVVLFTHDEGSGAPHTRQEPEVPPIMQRIRVPEDRVDSPSRFWDQVGLPLRRGDGSEITPDPYLATGQLPPLTSCFSGGSLGTGTLPVFDADRCTGCGDCWSLCPDSAIKAVVLTPQKFIEDGMRFVRETGESADVLRMAVSKLARGMVKTRNSGPAEALLQDSLTAFLASSKLDEARNADLERAAQSVGAALGDVPLACTAPFFEQAESSRKGSGELLALAIAPDACKGCGVCIEACAPGALSPSERDPGSVALARRRAHRIESFAPTSQRTLDMARNDPAVGPLASAMLTQAHSPLLAGGVGSEPGSGPRIAARQVLGLAADHLRPIAAERARHMKALEEELTTRIQENLAGALPRDLDTIARGLKDLQSPDVNLEALVSRTEAPAAGERVDADALERLVGVAQRIGEVRRALESGDSGLGRAPLAVTVGVGAGADWCGSFPHNPFGIPVVLDANDASADLARGLWEGQFETDLDTLRLLRHARLELDRPTAAKQEAAALTRLTWEDLSDEEKGWVAPLFLVGTDESLAANLSGISRIITAGIPIKIIALTELRLGMGSATGLVTPAETSASFDGDLGLFALAHPHTTVLQTSLAHPEHLAQGVVEALAHAGPAFIRIHAPSPERHGFDTDQVVARARLAVASRAHPLFRRAAVTLDGSMPSLDLSGNDDSDADWTGPDATPAQWAFAEARFATEFTALSPDDAERGLSLGAYLDLAPADRGDRIPVVPHPESGDPYRVSAQRVRMVERSLWNWRHLQRLGRDPQTAVTNHEHDAALAALREEYEARLASEQSRLKLVMAEQVRARLREMVTHGVANKPGGA